MVRLENRNLNPTGQLRVPWGALFVSVMATFLVMGCATAPPSRPPVVMVNIPPAFRFDVQEQHFPKGGDPLMNQWAPRASVAPFTRLEGFYGGPPDASERNSEDNTPIYSYGWTLDVFAYNCPQACWAYAKAKDGAEAQLDENVDLLSPRPPLANQGARADFFARFARKHFPWGDAVSFLSQYIDDTALYAPNNGHLFYEVWGVTRDKRFTIVMKVNVRHPKLSSWGKDSRIIHIPEENLPAVDTRSVAERQKAYGKIMATAIQNDPDYKLINQCSPTEFEPSLSAIDELLDSIRVR